MSHLPVAYFFIINATRYEDSQLKIVRLLSLLSGLSTCRYYFYLTVLVLFAAHFSCSDLLHVLSRNYTLSV